MNVGLDPTLGNSGAPGQLLQLLVVAQGEADTTGEDAMPLVVPTS